MASRLTEPASSDPTALSPGGPKTARWMLRPRWPRWLSGYSFSPCKWVERYAISIVGTESGSFKPAKQIGRDHGHQSIHRQRAEEQRCGALHEGNASVPDVWFFGSGGPNPRL